MSYQLTSGRTLTRAIELDDLPLGSNGQPLLTAAQEDYLARLLVEVERRVASRRPTVERLEQSKVARRPRYTLD